VLQSLGEREGAGPGATRGEKCLSANTGYTNTPRLLLLKPIYICWNIYRENTHAHIRTLTRTFTSDLYACGLSARLCMEIRYQLGKALPAPDASLRMCAKTIGSVNPHSRAASRCLIQKMREINQPCSPSTNCSAP